MARVETKTEKAMEREQKINELIKLACKHQSLINFANEQLKRIGQQLIELGAFDTSKTKSERVTPAGVAVYQRTVKVKIVDANKLADILREDFFDYVKEETVYKPTPKLRRAVLNGEGSLANRLRRCVGIKEYEYVIFKPAKQKRS